MKYAKTFVLFLIFIGCSKEYECGETEPFSPLSSTYIVLQSIEGKEYCISYSELTKVTTFDYLKLMVGKEERVKIFCGSIKLDINDFNKMMKDPHSPFMRFFIHLARKIQIASLI
ncbi:hypothetical protein EZE20_05150 [Arundinibacter roseus]|uniref:Lipoprotein n=1 Tax=Arundinibacter roseus TaxID=2070510 RepID=A0A4R4KKZ1_9BACT|nr:hypothetical protein EZE20_05150 [Arundinibacter roseus]